MKENLSLQAVFDNQIEKFRWLKSDYEQIEKNKKEFNYESQLQKIELCRDEAMNEISNSKALSDKVKQNAIDAIRKEFLDNKEALDTKIFEFDYKLSEIDSKREKLRSDWKYKEAIQIRHKYIQAQKNVNQLIDNKKQAELNLSEAQELFQQAKQNLELAQTWLSNIDNKLNTANLELQTVNENFTKGLSKVLSIDDVIMKAISYYEKNNMVIHILDGEPEQDLLKKIKEKLFYRIRKYHGRSDDINTKTMQIELSNGLDKITSWDKLWVYCCYKDLKLWCINIEIQIDKSSDVKENVTKWIEWEKLEKKNLEVEMKDIIGYIRGTRSNTIFATMMKNTVTWKDLNSTGIEDIFKNLQTIYNGYQKRQEAMELIFWLFLSVDEMKKFLELAASRASHRGRNINEFLWIYDTIMKLYSDKKYKSNKKEKRDIDLQILNYIGQAFWVNMVTELWKKDIGKFRHIPAWNCSWNARYNHKKYKKN